MVRKFVVKILLFCFLPVWLPAQPTQPVRNTGPALLVSFGYGPQFPVGELSDRFGGTWGIENAWEFIMPQTHWTLGLQGQYIFGSQVKEDVLAALRTAEGYLIGNDRSPADVQLRMRGYYLGARIGKIIGIGDNPRAGLRLSLGGGWLAHRIRIQGDPSRTVNQVVGDYRPGYDRLTSGPALYQFIGWQTLSRDGRVNFYAGLEFMEGFTQNQRSYDFALKRPLDEKRTDILIGLRLAWTLPFYFGGAEEIFY